jgi:hypothetical protein
MFPIFLIWRPGVITNSNTRLLTQASALASPGSHAPGAVVNRAQVAEDYYFTPSLAPQGGSVPDCVVTMAVTYHVMPQTKLLAQLYYYLTAKLRRKADQRQQSRSSTERRTQ